MKKSLWILPVIVVAAGCGDSKSNLDAGDGGRDATDAVAEVGPDGPSADREVGGPVDGSVDAADAPEEQDGFPSFEVGPEPDMTAVDSYRGAANSWWTFTGGTISVIQPVAGVLGTNIVVAGGRTSANIANTTVNATRYFAIPTPDQTGIVVNNGMPLAAARWGAAFTVAGGRLWAIGGSSSIGLMCLASVESLGGATEAWMPGPALPQARCGATAVTVGPYVYVTGGTSTPVPSRPVMLAGAATCRLDTGNIAAGWDCTSFAAGNDIATTSRFNTAGASTGSLALIVGGRDAANPLDMVNQVTQVGGNPDFAAGTTLPAALNLAGIASANGYFYAYGGSAVVAPNGAGGAGFWRTSNTTPGAWTAVSAGLGMPLARTGHVMVTARCPGCASDRLYVIGGHHEGFAAVFVDEYTE
jgi:Kelch motif